MSTGFIRQNVHKLVKQDMFKNYVSNYTILDIIENHNISFVRHYTEGENDFVILFLDKKSAKKAAKLIGVHVGCYQIDKINKIYCDYKIKSDSFIEYKVE